ncbi:hypothetical protein JXB22_00890 [candidate division WOR-3 bacterium]|nr:hypothetical protein [candidate division WOR-3 bacterium]
MESHKTYVVFDAISPRARMIASVFLVAIGYLFQLASRNILAGLPFIIACVVLNLVKSIHIKRTDAKKYEWQEVTPEKIDQVLEQCQRIKRFNTSEAGCIIAAFVVFMFGIVFIVPFIHFLRYITFPLSATIVNAIILFCGLAFSGRRHAWMPPALDIKAAIVKRLISHALVAKDPQVKALPYLEIGQGKDGTIPNDTRFMVRFIDGSEDFIGLQGQISINNVKGRAYPYFYVVIIAKPGFELFKKIDNKDTDKLVIERKKTAEVDVVVIRQKTTKTSGYHTDTAVQDHTLKTGIERVKKIFENHAVS